MFVFIDFQYFIIKEIIFVKEIAIKQLFLSHVVHAFVNLSFLENTLNKKEKAAIKWITRKVHGLELSGPEDMVEKPEWLKRKSIKTEHLEFIYVTDWIKQHVGNGTIFVKGLQKKIFLDKCLGNVVINLEDVDIPTIDSLRFNCNELLDCGQHYFVANCAVENVLLFQKWVQLNKVNLLT